MGVSPTRVAVFIDACFWHGCPDHYVRPRTGADFWSAKLNDNVTRDARQTKALEALGWRVCRFWEHQLWEDLDACVARVRAAAQAPVWRRTRSWRVFRVVPLPGDHEERHQRELRGCAPDRVVNQGRSTRKWARRGTTP